MDNVYDNFCWVKQGGQCKIEGKVDAKFRQFVIQGKFYLRKFFSGKMRLRKTRSGKTRSGITHYTGQVAYTKVGSNVVRDTKRFVHLFYNIIDNK